MPTPKPAATWEGPDELRAMLHPIEAVRPAPNNPKDHDANQVGLLADSLRRFGQRKPLVASVDKEGEITLRAGHGTRDAALTLGWTHVACVIVTESEAEARAYGLADNRLGELSTWNADRLQLELVALGDDFQPESIGWDAADLQLLGLRTSPAPDADPDEESPKPPADPVTRPGDLYTLGPHRLLCGDATSRDDVARLLGGVVPLLMVTDPPYGVRYDPAWRNRDGLAKTQRVGAIRNDDRVDWSDAWALFPGDVAYVWHAIWHCTTVAAGLSAQKMEVRSQLIWSKSRFAISRGAYHWQHEPCWYAVRKGRTASWCGDRSQSTIWEIPHRDGTGDTRHSTQKPVECMARPMRHHGAAGDHVYDPFMGSGTSLIDAHREERFCLGMEIDPGYCDVAVARWERYTGLKATVERSEG